jgi:phage portal protein BeeE
MIFDPPALTQAEIQARREAEQHRQNLEARYGGEVLEREVEAFEAVFRVARQHAEHAETMRAALRSGISEGRRRQAAVRAGGERR